MIISWSQHDGDLPGLSIWDKTKKHSMKICDKCKSAAKAVVITTVFQDHTALSLHLRLRERGRMGVVLRRSSTAMLSVQKCLERKCSSSGVGWKGSWCSFSCDEQDDWKWNEYILNKKRKKGDGKSFILLFLMKECHTSREHVPVLQFLEVTGC